MGNHPDSGMRAVLRCADQRQWKRLLLDTRVAGLPVLNRYLLALRAAGITQVTLVVPRDSFDEIESAAPDCVPSGVSFSVLAGPAANPVFDDSGLVLEQRADTLVDPRLLAQLVRTASVEPVNVVCLDLDGPNTARSKSPYRVGVAELDEARPVDTDVAERLIAVGAEVHGGAAVRTVHLSVGRYYWHRFDGPGDVAAATTKVLLATMKATDGFFARTNRRVSLRISRLLLNTSVTANMVTLVTLACGFLVGWLMSRGHYWAFVAGSVLAWFASMLDGVDGEIARAKFQATAFGHWLEMACDYVFYIALFVGLGVGYHRATGHGVWSAMGIASGIAIVLCFAGVAQLKRNYARRGTISDFPLAFERTARAPGNKWFMRALPHLSAFFTRAVFPYFLVLFALLGLLKVALVLMFVATQSFWIVAFVLSRLQVNLKPKPAAAQASDVARVDS